MAELDVVPVEDLEELLASGPPPCKAGWSTFGGPRKKCPRPSAYRISWACPVCETRHFSWSCRKCLRKIRIWPAFTRQCQGRMKGVSVI